MRPRTAAISLGGMRGRSSQGMRAFKRVHENSAEAIVNISAVKTREKSPEQ